MRDNTRRFNGSLLVDIALALEFAQEKHGPLIGNPGLDDQLEQRRALHRAVIADHEYTGDLVCPRCGMCWVTVIRLGAEEARVCATRGCPAMFEEFVAVKEVQR